MIKFTEEEIHIFFILFNRGGYVLNFSTDSFNIFTRKHVGIALCQKYGLSKGKSLQRFLDDADDEKKYVLITELFKYYENNMKQEYDKKYIPKSWESNFQTKFSEEYSDLYQECKKILSKDSPSLAYINNVSNKIKEGFSTEYMTSQIEYMKSAVVSNPTDAIGKAKELIESCCKTILNKENEDINKIENISQMTTRTLDLLNLLPENYTSDDVASKIIKYILGNLRSIPSKLAELRNLYGSGHGKVATFSELESRHAKLAVTCSLAFVEFVWSTYSGQKRNNKLP